MDALLFPNEEALEVALRSGLVPREVQQGQVQVARRAGGVVELVPAIELGGKALKSLKDAGVAVKSAGSGLTAVSCWAAALKPRRTDVSFQAPPRVLFTLPSQSLLLELCGELFRLGCDRQEFRFIDAPNHPIAALVRVNQPPWYVLSKALDRTEPLRAFFPTPIGQEQVWTELGFTHPLLHALEPVTDGVLLIPGEGDWLKIAEGEWTDVDRLIEPTQIPAAQTLIPNPLPRLKIHLALGRNTKPESPTLWVVKQGLGAIEALIRSTPEAALEGLLFAVSGDTVLLRVRPGREASAPTLPGAPYTRLFELPNLYTPQGMTIEPPLRRDRLRQWLASDAEMITWLEPKDAGFARVSVPENAFRPLTEWVDYIIDGGELELDAWVRSATFDFSDFTARDDVAGQRPVERTEPDERNRTKKPVRETKERVEATKGPAIAPVPRTRDAPIPTLPQVEVVVANSQLEEALAAEEASFLELEAAADSPERRDAWVRLGSLYAGLSRHREAGLCFAHAIWESDNEGTQTLAQQWAALTRTQLDGLIQATNPSSEQTSAVAAHLIAGAAKGDPSLAARQAQLVQWLDKYDEDLDVRSLWLARRAVSQLAGGDPLALARARDRVLARLTRGLSLERDVPRLLRVASQANAGGGTERVARVARQLEQLLKAFEETPRKRSPVEAPPALTKAYVGFEFAWGFARLGQAERARALREAGIKALPKNEPVHAFLTKAYSARIDQALEGLSPDTPLPPELSGSLNGYEPYVRYRVDRLRQFSEVLEPQERINAIAAFWRNEEDPRGKELAALRGMRDINELSKALEARTEMAADPQLPAEERTALLDAMLDFLPQLPESSALPLLMRYVALLDGIPARLKLPVLEDALRVAGHFGRSGLVKQLVLQFTSVMNELGAEGAGEVALTLTASLRSLRRVGLRQEAADMLTRVNALVRGDDSRALQTRLAVAGGFAYLGALAPAQPVFEEALSRLSREKDATVERLRITRAAARAISQLPTNQAMSSLLRLTVQLPWTSDSMSTNDSFSLSMIDLADSIVLGHVGDDLTLNEVTRRFIEEDEYLVRRRVHRDAGG